MKFLTSLFITFALLTHTSALPSLPLKTTSRHHLSLTSSNNKCTTLHISPTSLLNIPRGGSLAPPPPTTQYLTANPLLRNLYISALVTLLFELTLGHPIEFIKILKMTSPPTSTYLTIINTITSEKGVGGLWDGFLPWGVLQSVGKGGSFGLAFSFIRPLLDTPFIQAHTSMLTREVVSGGLAGGVQGYVLSPTLLLKTRVMTDPVFREKGLTLYDTTVKSLGVGGNVIRKEGVGALMKGSNVFAVKRVFDWSTRFLFASTLESLTLSCKHGGVGKLSDGEKVACSLIGGGLSAIATLPLDVLVAKLQDSAQSSSNESSLQLIRGEVKRFGVRGVVGRYCKGWEARVLHVGLTTVAIKSWTPMMYQWVYGEK